MNEENHVPEDMEREGMFDEVEVPESSESHAPKSDYLLPASIIVAALIVSGALYLWGGHGASQNNQGTPAGNGTGQPVTALTDRDVILGNPNAPVTLIEYGDYQCPFCARFFEDAEHQIRANYIQTGKAKMVFRNLAFLGPESNAAAAAAECAGDQHKFWEYHDALYQAKISDTQNGGGENDGYLTQALLVRLAANLKLDAGVFTQCVATKKYDTQIVQDTKVAGAAGVASTPTLYINGTEIKGAQPYAIFGAAIDTALATGK